MKYVLIAMWTSYSPSMHVMLPAPMSAQFESRAACEAARKNLEAPNYSFCIDAQSGAIAGQEGGPTK